MSNNKYYYGLIIIFKVDILFLRFLFNKCNKKILFIFNLCNDSYFPPIYVSF